jgi:hypothetical protein
LLNPLESKGAANDCAEAYKGTPHKNIPQIDTAKAKKSRFRMETNLISLFL